MSSTSTDAPTPRRVAINGKFLAAPMTGVHRVADALIKQWDEQLAEANAERWEIIAPRDARDFGGLSHISMRRGGVFTWQPWEQFDLPRLAHGRMLVNLCNLAPLITPGVTLIHDAQVYISPTSYSKPFVAWYKTALPRIGRAAAKIVTVSDYSKAQLVAHGVAAAEQIEVVHNGVDHIFETPSSSAALQRFQLAPRRYVVALANVQTHKNIAVLLRAFAALPQLHLVLIGADDRAAFARAGQPAPDNVIFAGRLSDAEMRGLFERALCFACPSTTEGFGMPPLEAMLVGCPAVIAPCGALPEVCGDAAIAADAYAPEAWSRAIALLSENEAHWERHAALGRRQAERFTWRRAGRAFMDIIHDASLARQTLNQPAVTSA